MPMSLPYYPLSHHSPCPLSQARLLEGDSPPRSWASGCHAYDWRAAAPTLFVFVLAATCTMLRQILTPGLALKQHPCMQPPFTPNSSPPTPLHLIAISILAINCLSRARCWASSQLLLKIDLPSTSTQPTPLTPANTQPPHALAKYTKEPWLYPPPPLTNERSSVGRAQATHRLASRWYPSSIHSSNSLGCIV